MAKKRTWRRPPPQQQFTILGVQPWGGPDDHPNARDVLSGKKPAPPEYPEVLGKCALLADTAVEVSRYVPEDVTRLEEEHCVGLPIHPYALEDAIREYYTRQQWLSPADVMRHCGRAVERLLFMTGDRQSPKPEVALSNEEEARRARMRANEVRKAIQRHSGG